jgi:D-alanyl-D-alanine carboxypeptidase (penicillin-binding protein 5/6)
MAAGMLVIVGFAASHARSPAPVPVRASASPRTFLVGPVPAPTPGPLGFDWLATHPAPDLDIHSGAAVLVDLDTREIMWARDERTPRAPASLTKLMTAMVASDLATSLDQQVTVPLEATQVEADSTVMGLSPGEVVAVRDLMYGMLLVSGNDAAETLSRVFTDRVHFVGLMNEKAAALGMRDSTFTNPSGLDDPGLRASAHDLAIAAVTVAAHYPSLLGMAGAKDENLAATATHKAFFMHSLIKLIAVYPGATGLKTGYTDDAGYCLVGTATRSGRHLAVVLLHSDLALTVDATRLLDYGFAQPLASPFDPSTFPQL